MFPLFLLKMQFFQILFYFVFPLIYINVFFCLQTWLHSLFFYYFLLHYNIISIYFIIIIHYVFILGRLIHYQLKDEILLDEW
jgi:hypothetical protein